MVSLQALQFVQLRILKKRLTHMLYFDPRWTIMRDKNIMHTKKHSPLFY